MNKLLKILFLLLIGTSLFAQEMPYQWTYEINSLNSNEYQVKAICEIDSNWHVYSIHNPDGGSIKTSFKWENSKDILILSDWTEPTPTKVFEDVFDVEQWYHSDRVEFKSTIKVADGFQKDSLTLEIKNMACTDEGMCTPPDQTLLKIPLPKDNTSLYLTFLLSFGAGFLALLTPCVFPMVPMTVTYFTKQKANGVKKAMIYGISIVLIYVILGLGITLIFGESALYNMSSSVSFNLLFFIIFLIFAISFLGAFEITLPQKWVNKMDAKSDRGGLIGIFFMAFTLTLVSFSCTGPIMGSILVKTAIGGDVLMPLVGMLGFGLALGIPFTLFAIFPSWLNKLPKSGGWLNSVKVVLGFLELALAFKFLSNADLVLQAGWLKREVFIAIWIAIFLLTTIYLLGKIQLSHDSKVEKLSVGRTFFALLFLSFTIYLLPGMFGAPLKLLSGVLPPATYAEGWNIQQNNNNQSVSNKHAVGELSCPNQLECFHNYDEGLAAAKKVNKPILLDFTGFTCANCRRMEENVWTDPKIDQLIRDEYVLISLYVDDEQHQLPPEEQYVSSLNGKKITTYGGKWKDLQISKYQEISQPLYILLNHKENMLAPKMGYETNVEVYYNFLKQGLEEFKQQQ